MFKIICLKILNCVFLFVAAEISARPADVTVRIRLLNFFLECKRYKIAYQYALELEIRNLFNNDLRWYDCLANVIQVCVSQYFFKNC